MRGYRRFAGSAQLSGGVVLLGLLAVVGGWASATAAASDQPPAVPGIALAAIMPGTLQVDVAPSDVTPDNSVATVRVANTGDGVVRDIAIHAEGPPGVTTTVEPASFSTLAANASVLAEITTRGVPESRPAPLVVRVTGESDGTSTAALTSVDLVPTEPSASITLTGNTRVTDSSPADLVVLVANTGDVPAEVTVRAMAGQHLVRLAAAGGDVRAAEPDAPLTVTVPARRSRVALLQVQAQRPLRRGTTALVVTATVRTPRGGAPVDLSESRELDVGLSADVLPGLLGVGSVLIVPGLVAIWAALTVLQRDRRQLGLDTPPAGAQLWDNKLWLLAAAAVSLAGARLYSAAGFPDLLDTYTLSDIAVLTVTLGLLTTAGATAAVWRHRRTVPAVRPTATPLAVLRAAARADGRAMRPVYRTPDGKLGLWVHTDRDAAVLVPPVEYTEIDVRIDLKDDAPCDSLSAALMAVDATPDADNRLRFVLDGEYVEGPRAEIGAVRSRGQKEPILRYVDEF